MAEVYFKTDAKISIPDGAVKYAEKLIAQENKDNRKLRELIKKRIEEINTHQKRLCYESNMATDYDMELQTTRAELQKLLKESKK